MDVRKLMIWLSAVVICTRSPGGTPAPEFTVHGPLPANEASICISNDSPHAVSRVVDILTSVPQPGGVPGVNLYDIRGYNLQSGSTSLAIQSQSGEFGMFSVTNGWLAYAPGVIGTAARLDPWEGTYYDLATVVLSDGPTPLPPVTIRVISFSIDIEPDGLPDAWAQGFGVGGATNDPDGDGFDNLHEWLCGTSPIASNDYLRVTGFSGTSLSWPARAYDAYEQLQLDGADGPVTNRIPVVPTTNPGTCSPDLTAPSGFYRIERVP